MELNFLLLEQRRLEAEIAAAGERDDYERRAALSRERAALVERIARTERVGVSVQPHSSVCISLRCFRHGKGMAWRSVLPSGHVARRDRR